MTAANSRFEGLTASHVRDIYRNKAGRTIRQMAIHYGVSEQTIREARRYQARRANPSRRGRIALVNA
ncbi:helix-turn-helix DNA binding domain protein [Mycobacterium phage Leopard]|nr:helix-turn-helix DNA binding domain protein [Mycobacterium phage Leopard]